MCTSLNFIRRLVEKKIFETGVNSWSRERDDDENRSSGFALQIPSGAPKLHLPRETVSNGDSIDYPSFVALLDSLCSLDEKKGPRTSNYVN